MSQFSTVQPELHLKGQLFLKLHGRSCRKAIYHSKKGSVASFTTVSGFSGTRPCATQRWDQVTVFQVQVESQVFAVKSKVKSQVKSGKSVKSQVKSQVKSGKSKSSLKSRAIDKSHVSSQVIRSSSLKQVFLTNVIIT